MSQTNLIIDYILRVRTLNWIHSLDKHVGYMGVNTDTRSTIKVLSYQYQWLVGGYDLEIGHV